MILELSTGLAIVGLCFIFLILIGLCYLVVLQRRILQKFDGKDIEVPFKAEASNGIEALEIPASNLPVNEEDDGEIMAVISAAVAAMLEGTSSQVRIRSIRRVGQTGNSWVSAGRQELIGTRL